MQSKYTLEAEGQKMQSRVRPQTQAQGRQIYCWDIIYKGFLAEEDTIPVGG